jgi:hypothetical protein
MPKSKASFKDIEILKERLRLRILEQELKIKSEFRELGDRFTGQRLKNSIQENLLGNSGLAFKLGFMAVNLIAEGIRNRRNKRKR